MTLDCKFRDPPSFCISLPLVHGTIESVSEYFLIITQELCSKIGMLVALHGTQGRLYRPYSGLLIRLPHAYCEIERT